METTTTPIRVAVVAAAAACVFFAAKSTAIAVAGGIGLSPLETPLFFAGFASMVIAAVAVCLALTTGRPVAWRIAAAVGGIVAVALVSLAAGIVASALRLGGPSWVRDEVTLWAGAAAVLVAAVWVHRAQTSP